MGASCFSEKEKEGARKVRDKIRNKWAHDAHDDAIWTDSYFLNCFQIMEDLTICLPNPEDAKLKFDKIKIKTELYEWKVNGLKMLNGTIDIDSVKQVMKGCENLMKAVASEIDGIGEV